MSEKVTYLVLQFPSPGKKILKNMDFVFENMLREILKPNSTLNVKSRLTYVTFEI